MSYSNVPNSGESLGVTRPLINTNFSLIQTAFAVNHIGFGLSGAGKHKISVYPVGAAAALIPPLAGEIALYAKTGFASDLFIGRDGNNAFEVRLTNSSIPAPVVANNGVTFLPGVAGSGMLIQWGQVANPGASGSVVFSPAFAAAPYTIQLTPRNDGSHSAFTYYIDGAPTSSGFSYRGSTSGSQTLYWLAIGTK